MTKVNKNSDIIVQVNDKGDTDGELKIYKLVGSKILTKVLIVYRFEGEIRESDNEYGLLLPNNTVLSSADGNFDIFVAKKIDAGTYLVDLDDETSSLGLMSNPEMLIDILALG
ncbi:hypothetical protein SAFG77S_08039 [Streptomyces afghaniensis]